MEGLQRVAQRLKGLEMQELSATAQCGGVAGESFDCVFCRGALHHTVKWRREEGLRAT